MYKVCCRTCKWEWQSSFYADAKWNQQFHEREVRCGPVDLVGER